MHIADMPLSRAPGTGAEPKISWSSLRLLTWRLWTPLLAALLMTLAMASFGEEALHGSWTRPVLWVMTALTLALLAVLTRLFLVQAERQAQDKSAAERLARELEKQVEMRTRELSALSTHLQELSEKEKSELARNLHDELGGLLTAAKMDLSWLQSRLDAPPIRERLLQLGNVLDEAMDLKRRVVEDLRPSLLDHFGLPTALRAYVDSACAKAGLKREIRVPEDSAPIGKDIAIALFRIVQEGLTNTIRHAGAQTVRLVFTTDAAGWSFVLSDDGCGFDVHDPRVRCSHGIMGMQQRVRALGGELALESSPGAGTTLRVRVPAREGRL
jgi:signal transduction histidine kinase